MNQKTTRIGQSLRFNVISRVFALIVILLTFLGLYQYILIGNQAEKQLASDRQLATNYFSSVLVQAMWEFDKPLIDELVAAQSNIRSLVTINITDFSPGQPPWYIRNESDLFVPVVKAEIPTGEIRIDKLPVVHGEKFIGTIVLYFDQNFYQRQKREGIAQLLLELLGLTVIVLSLFYVLINWYVVKPISRLHLAVEKLSHDEEGRFNLQKELPDNEIRLLANRYFDAYSQLSEHKAHLQELVKIRTQGLTEANQKMAVEIENRIASEKAMQAAKTEAQEANSAKTRFLSHITHELRTPLNGIIGYTQVLADKALGGDEKALSTDILRCSQHLLELINNILDYNKLESTIHQVTLKTTSLNELAEGIRTIVYPRCKSKGIDFQLNISSHIPPSLSVDAGKLKQVLINLLANGIKFTHKGMVELSIQTVKKDIFLFTVSDSGQGIPSKDLQTIFLPYEQSEQTDTSDASTGLGLSISKTLVESMGGQLEVTSEINKGSRFFFSLELFSTGKSQAIKPKDKIVALQGAEGMQILIVDDNRDNVFILRKVLENVGFNITQAPSAELAFQQIENICPDLIFMDVQMPEMDGTQAARIIKQTHPEMTIIAFTANLYSESNQQSELDVFDGFVYKPINRQAIYRCLVKKLKLTAIY